MSGTMTNIALWIMGSIVMTLFILRVFFGIEWSWSYIAEVALIYAGHLVIRIRKD